MGSLIDLGRLFHFGRQLDGLAGNHECAFAKMMNRLRVFLQRVNPRLEHLKDKEVVFGYHFPVYDPAFKIGVALVDERRLDAGGGHRREAKVLELVDRPAGGVTAAHYLCSQFHCWNIDYAFPGRFHYVECVVPAADYATYERRFKLKHGVPRQGHDVRSALSGGADHHNRSGLEQAVDFG